MQTYDVVRDAVARILWAVALHVRCSMDHYDYSVVVLRTMHQIRYTALPVAVAVRLVEIGVAEGRIPNQILTDLHGVVAAHASVSSID